MSKKKYRSPEHQAACKAAKVERRKLQMARAHWAAMCAYKLTEMGYPTTASAGYAVLKAKIQLACPEIQGSRTEVFARFVGEGESASTLRRQYAAAVNARKSARRGAVRAKPSTIFYESREWRELRYRALVKNGGACQACGATAKDGARIHVDHIKPRSLFPKLELEISNLQVLCEDCNLGKSNKDTTDWRTEEAA